MQNGAGHGVRIEGKIEHEALTRQAENQKLEGEMRHRMDERLQIEESARKINKRQ